MEEDPTCSICGCGPEDAFHAMLHCMHACELWLSMRREWNFPGEHLFVPTIPEWILKALHEMTMQQCAMTLMILW